MTGRGVTSVRRRFGTSGGQGQRGAGTIRVVRRSFFAVLLCSACVRPVAPVDEPSVEAAPPVAVETVAGSVVVSIVGTNDVHGHVEALPVLGGYLENLRRVRADDGGVLLVDAGDMWQGTLESNLEEGAPVVAAYDALGYDAVAIGNHEFDYGPVGPAATVGDAGDGADPRGALRARAASASFPFLMANVVEASGEYPAWDNVMPTTQVEIAGVQVGLIGLTTIDTPRTTIAANFAGLEVLPLAPVVARHAAQLRERGAAAVVVVAHAGGRCRELDDPDDLASCDTDHEVFRLVDALPPGTVDVIVAGHTHAGIAHRYGGVAIVESFSYGRAFGRVDLRIDREAGRVVEAKVWPPQNLCAQGRGDSCVPSEYEGGPVVPDETVARAIAPALERAAELRREPLSVVLEASVQRGYDRESALGNLVADLMREASGADVAVTNGGGLRADLPAGPLTYGALYEALPFDNRLAHVKMSADALARMLAENLGRDRSILSVSGLRAVAQCKGGELVVQLHDAKNRRIRPTRTLHVVTSDFLATGGDGAFGEALDAGAVTIETERPFRDVLADLLRTRGGTIHPDHHFEASRPRLEFTGPRPVRCAD